MPINHFSNLLKKKMSEKAEAKSKPIAESLRELGLQKYIPDFDKKGFTDWASLGSDISEVKESLNGVVKKDEAPGDYNRLVHQWQELDQQDQKAREAEEANKNGSPIEFPVLKPGTELDLSSDFATLPTGESYKFPEFSVIQATEEVVHPNTLKKSDWIRLAAQNELLFGFSADSLLSDYGQKSRPPHPAFKWRVPADDYFFSAELQAEYNGSVSYTESSKALASQRIFSAEAQIACPFGSAAASYSRNSKDAESDSQKKIRMTGWWRVPRARMYIDECTVLSPEFVTAVTTAMRQNNPFAELHKVFNRFGNLYAEEVVLGGQMYFTHEVVATGNVASSEVQQTAAAAAKLKAGSGEGGASASFTDGQGIKTDAKSAAEASKWVCVGGDTTLNESPKTWPDTVKPPVNWSLILREKTRPLTSRLTEQSLRDEVEAVWRFGRTVLWDGAPLPVEYSFPDLKGSRFMLVSLANGRPVVANPGNPKASWGFAGDMGSPETKNMLWRLYPTGVTSSPNQMGSAYYYVITDLKGECPPRDIPLTEAGTREIAAWRTKTFSNGTDMPPAIMGQILGGTTIGQPLPAFICRSIEYKYSGDVQWRIISADASGARGINGFLLQNRGGGFLRGDDFDGPYYEHITLERLQALPPDRYAHYVWNLIPIDSDGRLEI